MAGRVCRQRLGGSLCRADESLPQLGLFRRPASGPGYAPGRGNHSDRFHHPVPQGARVATRNSASGLAALHHAIHMHQRPGEPASSPETGRGGCSNAKHGIRRIQLGANGSVSGRGASRLGRERSRCAGTAFLRREIAQGSGRSAGHRRRGRAQAGGACGSQAAEYFREARRDAFNGSHHGCALGPRGSSRAGRLGWFGHGSGDSAGRQHGFHNHDDQLHSQTDGLGETENHPRRVRRRVRYAGNRLAGHACRRRPSGWCAGTGGRNPTQAAHRQCHACHQHGRDTWNHSRLGWQPLVVG